MVNHGIKNPGHREHQSHQFMVDWSNASVKQSRENRWSIRAKGITVSLWHGLDEQTVPGILNLYLLHNPKFGGGERRAGNVVADRSGVVH
jgi:hypothetical protein